VVVDVKSTGDHYELEVTTAMQMKGHTDAFLAALETFTSSSGSVSSLPRSRRS
jgi:hypothetical protein